MYKNNVLAASVGVTEVTSLHPPIASVTNGHYQKSIPYQASSRRYLGTVTSVLHLLLVLQSTWSCAGWHKTMGHVREV
jgi:hypothetical protein